MASFEINQDHFCKPGEDAQENKLCQLCEKKGKKNDTVGYCKDCMKYLCENCLSSHQHTKQTKHHVLFDWKSRTKSFRLTKPKASKSTEDVCTISCDAHPDKMIEYICTVDDAIGCSICMTMKHKNCGENVKHIPQLSVSLDESDDYKDICRDLVSMVQKSQTLVKGINSKKKKVEHYSARLYQDVKKFQKQLEEASVDQETGIMIQIDKARQEDQDKLDTCINKYDSTCKKVERLMSGLQALRTGKQNSQLFVRMKMARANMETLQHVLYSPEDTSCMQYQFQPEWETLQVMKNEDALGKLTKRVNVDAFQSSGNVKEKIMVFENPSSISENPTQEYVNASDATDSQLSTPVDEPDGLPNGSIVDVASVPSQDDTMTDNGASPLPEDDEMDPNKATDICVMSKEDTYPVSVSSLALLPDNNLVVIDMANWKVKLLDTQRNVLIQELHEQGCPWDVTTIAEDEVAITFPMLRRIIVYKYETTLRMKKKRTCKNLRNDREIHVRGHCYGIAYTSDKMVVTYARDWLLDGGPTRVEILNMQGNILQRITDDDEGEKLFYDPRYVAVNEDAKMTLYISDWGDDSVTSLVVETSGISTYENEKLKKPGKITIDSNGSMYICGQGSDNVHRVLSEGTGLEVMLSGDGLVAPRSICVAEGQGTIYVGMIGCKFIRTYHIL